MGVVTPEMSGKIIDDSHFDFHVTGKAKMVNAINKWKGGVDMLKTLSHLKFTTDKRWLQNSCGDPSVQALIEIIEEYKKVEHRPNRAAMLVPLMEYAVGLYASDLFFRERGSWLILQLFKRREAFEICTVFKDPLAWYPMTRNPDMGDGNGPKQGTGGYFYKYENSPDVPSIEQEYKSWYYVDVNGDTIEIPKEIRDRVIAENIKCIKETMPDVQLKETK